MLTICFGAWLSGCGGPNANDEADYQNRCKLVIQMMDLLDTVKDDNAAEAAKPKLDELYDQIQVVNDKVSEMPRSVVEKLEDRNKDLVNSINRKVSDQVGREMRGALPQGMSKYLFVVSESRRVK